MAIFFPADAAPRPVSPPDGRTAFTLQELQRFVGGFIEAVGLNVLVQPDGTPVVLFVNQDGKRGPAAPVNRYATALTRMALVPGDVIVGDAILCTLAEAGETDAGDADG
jgi:hypothetical protein